MECTDCRGTGLRGGNGTTPDHVGALVTCTTCGGTGVVADTAIAGDAADEKPALSTPENVPAHKRGGILGWIGL